MFMKATDRRSIMPLNRVIKTVGNRKIEISPRLSPPLKWPEATCCHRPDPAQALRRGEHGWRPRGRRPRRDIPSETNIEGQVQYRGVPIPPNARTHAPALAPHPKSSRPVNPLLLRCDSHSSALPSGPGGIWGLRFTSFFTWVTELIVLPAPVH